MAAQSHAKLAELLSLPSTRRPLLQGLVRPRDTGQMAKMTDNDPSQAKGPDGALVLFSGGQDSASCLAWALDRYRWVETVGFDYGQRHIVEMEARKTVRTHVAASFP